MGKTKLGFLEKRYNDTLKLVYSYSFNPTTYELGGTSGIHHIIIMFFLRFICKVIHLNFSPYLKARLKTNNSCHFTRHRGVLIRPSTNYRRSSAAFANWAPIIWNQLGDCTAVLNTSLSVKQWANMKISRCSDIATILSSFVGSV